MMTMMLPIPAKKTKVEFFYVPYHLKDGFVNRKANVLARETETVATLRETVFTSHCKFWYLSNGPDDIRICIED